MDSYVLAYLVFITIVIGPPVAAAVAYNVAIKFKAQHSLTIQYIMGILVILWMIGVLMTPWIMIQLFKVF